MLIPSFASFHQTTTGSSLSNQPNTNDFVQEEQPVIPNEQLQPQEHIRVCKKPTRNKQPPRCGTAGHRRH